jgi:hypothetical protein
MGSDWGRKYYVFLLNSDGSEDTSFNMGNGFDGDINKLATRPN